MEVQVNDTVYTKAELESMSKEQLQGICNDLGKEFHPRNNEENLIKIILGEKEGTPGFKSETDEPVESLADQVKVPARIGENEGIVELRVKNPKRTGSLRVRDYTDVNGNKHELRKNGDPWVVMVTKKKTLDLSKPDDKALYEHLKNHPYVLGTNGLQASLELYHEGEDAVKEVDLFEQGVRAQNIIMNLEEDALRNFARVLGIGNAHTKSAVVVKNDCYNICKSDPQKILTEWNDPHRELKGVLHKAIDKGMITRINNVFKYDNLSVGATFDEMVLWFEKNQDLLPNLRKKVE